MTITLTREEAQQVLDAFLGMGQRAADAMDGNAFHECSIAVSRLRARLAQPEPEYRDVVIKGDLWRIEFLPDHAASVVLVRANYEAQPEPEPVAWLHSFTGYGWQVVPEKLYPTDQPLYTTPPQAEPKPVADKYLMEVECTKCGAKQDGILTVNAPPQREWQGLTDEEREEATGWSVEHIESKLKEKNT